MSKTEAIHIQTYFESEAVCVRGRCSFTSEGDLLELGYSLFTVFQTMIDIMDVVLPHNQVPAADIDMLGEFSA